MPALAARDINVPQPPTPKRSGKEFVPAKQPQQQQQKQPLSADPLVTQRCLAFLAKLQAQHSASQGKSTHSHYPPLPDLAGHVAALSTPSPPLLHVGAAYETVGHWLHNCDKHTQAVAILRNAATVYEACNAGGKALLARIDVGRALNAVALAQQAEQEGQADVDQAHQHWVALCQQLQDKDLRLESYACYHHGQLHAQLAARCKGAESEKSAQLLATALQLWSQLAEIPSRYPPTARAADGDHMIKHRQHVLRVEEAVQAAAQRCALYSQHQQQIVHLQWLAGCLAAAMLHLPAAICWLQCGIAAAHDRHSSMALQHLAQAEMSHSQPAGIAAATLDQDKMAMYELRYAVLHYHLTFALQPPSSASTPLPATLSAFLSRPTTSLSFQHQMLRAQLLSVVSRIEMRRGRITESEARCRQEYKLWSGCLRRLCVINPATTSSTPMSVSDMPAVIATLPMLTHDQHVVLSGYIDCLYRYARLLERQGQPLLCIAHTHKATATCEALEERRQRQRLDRLRWRVKVKLGWQPERPFNRENKQSEVNEKEKWESAAEEAMQSLEAEVAETRRVGTDLHMQAQLSVELADAYLRRGQLQAARDEYHRTLAIASQLANQSATLAEVTVTDLPKRKTRTTTARATKQSTKPSTNGESNQPEPRSILQQAVVQGKLASIALSSFGPLDRMPNPPSSPSLPLEDAVSTLVHSSGTFQHQQRHVELAWAAYWQAAAQREDLLAASPSSRPVWSFPNYNSSLVTASTSTSLKSRCASPAASLLHHAVSSSSASSPPYISRLLLTSLCSSLGLSCPLDTIFALNSSLGIATRHLTDRSRRHRSNTHTSTTDDSLSEQLTALQISDGTAGQTCSAPCGRVAQDEFNSTFGVDMEENRQRFEVDFLARLPAEWTVVTVALSDDQRHLLVSRFQSPCHARAPVMLRLPITSQKSSPAPPSAPAQPQPVTSSSSRTARGKGKLAATAKAVAPPVTAPIAAQTAECPPAASSSYYSIMGELRSVLDASGRVNSSSLRSQHTCTYEERKQWWTERERLDERMKRLLERMEDDWFGAWKGVLRGDDRDESRRRLLDDGVSRVVRSMPQSAAEAGPENASSALRAYVRVLLQSPAPLTPCQLQSAAAYLLGWTDSTQETDAAMHALQASRSATDRHQLQSICALIEAERQALHPTPSTQCPKQPSLPVILLLSAELQRLPFESMPVLHGQPVTRMPSWLQLLPHLPPLSSATTLQAGVHTGLSLASHSYILNPGADLPRTQSTFEPLLSRLNLTTGLTATQPTGPAFLAALRAHLFLYVGHGCGDQYVGLGDVAGGEVGGVCLLMGCSSARGRGGSVEYEGCEGMCSALLVGGAKCVVGNLWDVTDGECDRFAARLLEQITGKDDTAVKDQSEEAKEAEAKPARKVRGKKAVKQVDADEAHEPIPVASRSRSICELVASSRSACKLRYLMGGSPVVYGIPTAFMT